MSEESKTPRRYTFDSTPDCTIDEGGGWICYEDYRQLETRLAACRAAIRFVWDAAQFDWATMPEEGRRVFHSLVSETADKALSDTEQ